MSERKEEKAPRVSKEADEMQGFGVDEQGVTSLRRHL